ncbi:MAG: efflux RND transporter periplasmic adaptor subunit, partial [Peptococcaceae bacterium]|nr:efflux RND transporter periplasmic adaptor subunit [Peptococcaceae bacterium]
MSDPTGKSFNEGDISGDKGDSTIKTHPGFKSLDEENVKKILFGKRIKLMSRKHKILWLTLLFLIVGFSIYGWNSYLGSQDTLTWSTVKVVKSDITDSIEATGTLVSVKESAMGFKSDGIITALNVQPGDRVKSGDILARQDTASLKALLEQARNTVLQDEISVKSARLTLETSQKNFNRMNTLFSASGISRNELDTAENTYTKSRLDFESAQVKLAGDRTKLVQAQADMSEATIIAPFDGIIGAVNGQVGQINGINASSSTLLTVMSNELQISAMVNQADIGRIDVGQQVKFTSNSYSDKIFMGKVIRITPQASNVSNVQYYPVLISCDDPEGLLLSGMAVSAEIIVSSQKDCLTVPMMAVSFAQEYNQANSVQGSTSKIVTDSKGQSAKVLILDNGQPVLKDVVLGLSD